MIPASRSATAPSCATSCIGEIARPLGLDVEHADDLVVPGKRNGQHGGHEPALVDAADPQEARIGLDVGDDQRSPVRRHASGDALAERDPRPADLEPIEPIRDGQGQVRSVAVEQVERGNIGVEHIARPVHHRLEELVPGPGRRGELRDLVEEAELGEPLRAALGEVPTRRRSAGIARSRARAKGRHGQHHTSLRKVAGRKGCDAVAARTRNGRAGSIA